MTRLAGDMILLLSDEAIFLSPYVWLFAARWAVNRCVALQVPKMHAARSRRFFWGLVGESENGPAVVPGSDEGTKEPPSLGPRDTRKEQSGRDCASSLTRVQI